jgi:hypothetical protein
MLIQTYARPVCLFIFIIAQFAARLDAQTVYNTVADGNWSSNSTWQGGASGKPPVSGNCNCTININPGHRLTINQSVDISDAQIVLLGNGSELRFASIILPAQTMQLTGNSGIELRNSGANIQSTSSIFGYNGNSISINGTEVFQGHATEVNSTTPGVVNGPATVNSTMSPVVFVNMVLPVKLVAFGARESNGNVGLEWRTAGETNFDRFEIERSVNSRDWSKIGTVDGRGGGSTGTVYSFVDRGSMAGVNYYRLKMMDRDGQSEYSSIAVVNITSQNERMKVYPNPATSLLYISNIHPGASQYVEVINASGQVVLRNKSQSAGNTISLNVGALGRGLYYLKLSDASGSVQTSEIVIK